MRRDMADRWTRRPRSTYAWKALERTQAAAKPRWSQGHSYTSDDGRCRTRNVVKAQQVDEDQPKSERPDPAPRGIEPFDDPSLIGRVSACFLTGVILTAPITKPILLVWLFLTFLDTHVAGLWPERYNQATYCRSACRGSGCLVTLAFPTLVAC
jgi:hypothetical protein